MKERFTLFHLDGERGFRGGERQLLYLASHLRRRGHQNVVACREGEELASEARRQGFAVLALPFLGEWDPVSALRLRKAAASAGPAGILHAHTGHAAALAALASRFGGPPWIAHRRVDFRLNGRLSRKLKYEAADRVVAVSESIRGILAEDGVSPSRVSVVPDCVPIDDEEAETASVPGGRLRPPTASERAANRRLLLEGFGIPVEAPLVGNLAALVGHKDQETLLRAAALVLGEKPGVRFAVLGEGPLRVGLAALARELGIERSVLLPGRQPDARPWLGALDLYVQSSWGEGMGSVLLEAAACGVPIAATTAGGIPEVVTDGRSALLVPPRDPAGLAAAILSSFQDPSSARARAAAALEGLSRFSLSALGDRMIGIYREVAARAPA